MDIKNVSMDRADISETLSKIRAISSQTKAFSKPAIVEASEPNFNSLMSIAKNSIKSVNATQAQSESLKNSYILGDSAVSISQVMMSSIKSKIAFEGLLVVRNKLIDAYKEIMNMPL